MEIPKINTRIRLRSDTQENWEQSDTKLLSGETVFSFQDNGTVHLRVGNGSTFDEAAKLELEGEAEIKEICMMILQQLSCLNANLDSIRKNQSNVMSVMYA